MKSIHKLLLALLLASGVGFTSVSQAANLRFADSFPLEHYLSKQGMVWWMDRVNELSDETINFDHYPAGQLSKGVNILQRIRQGAIDVGYVGIGYVTDRMPLSGVGMLPGLVSDPVSGSRALWAMIADGSLKEEFDRNDVVPMFAVVLPAYQLALSRARPNGMDDIKPLRIGGSGTLLLSAEAIGGSPVSMPATDIYLGMQRGALDGALLPGISLPPYHIHEVTKSISTNGEFGSFIVTVAMRKQLFDEMTDEQQQILMQAGQETQEHLSQYMKEAETKVMQEFRDSGIDAYVFDETFKNQLHEKLETVQAEWVERMQSRNLDGRKVLDEFIEELGKQH